MSQKSQCRFKLLKLIACTKTFEISLYYKNLSYYRRYEIWGEGEVVIGYSTLDPNSDTYWLCKPEQVT